MIPKRKTQAELQKQIDTFNATHAVGSIVTVKLDDGQTLDVEVEYPATILGGHTAVGWFKHPEISGAYALDRVVGKK